MLTVVSWSAMRNGYSSMLSGKSWGTRRFRSPYWDVMIHLGKAPSAELELEGNPDKQGS
jgi:hypothetical protein